VKALFAGRFQPFHKGHLHALKKISKEAERVFIVIGSAQYANTKENPFSADEREEMIKRALDSEGIANYGIYKVPDVNDDAEWAKHICSFVPDFDAVYSGNRLVRKLLKAHGKKVIPLKHVNRGELSGTEIRRKISENLEWRSFLPKSVSAYIAEIGGDARIKKLMN